MRREVREGRGAEQSRAVSFCIFAPTVELISRTPTILLKNTRTDLELRLK